MSVFEIIYPLCILAILTWVSVRAKWFQLDGKSDSSFYVATGLKILVCILFYLIYTSSLTAGQSSDSLKYFKESHYLYRVWFDSKMEYLRFLFSENASSPNFVSYLGQTEHWSSRGGPISDTRNMLRFNSIIHFFSFGNYFVHVVIFSFISSQGLYHLAKAFSSIAHIREKVTFWILVLFPSMLFWCAGIMKEPFLILGLGLLLRGLVDRGDKRMTILLIVGGLLVLLMFKSYVLLGVFLAFTYYILSKKLFPSKVFLSTLVLSAAFLGIFSIVTPIRDRVVESLSTKQIDFNNLSRGGVFFRHNSEMYFVSKNDYDKIHVEDSLVQVKEKVHVYIYRGAKIREDSLFGSAERYPLEAIKNGSKSHFEQRYINNSYGNLLQNIPQAMIDTLCRPFPGDQGGVLKYFSIAEYVVLFTWFFYAFWKRNSLTLTQKRILGSIFVFGVAMSLLIGWVTPISGAIVRYRIVVYLAVILSILILKTPNRWKKDLLY